MIQIGNYSVDEIPIGSGGMGQVLRGVDPSGRPVALKKILPQFVSDYEYRNRIQQEIAFLRKLDHPNVVKVYDEFTLDGNLFIVMELIEGRNLEQYVREKGPIPWQDAIRMMNPLLDTLQYVHEHGIVHRDIKPGNIMVKPDGSVSLLDFGVAKNMQPGDGSHPTTVLGSTIGTDGYMSPEQAEGLSIDHRSDVYALGCVFYFMLTGRHAYVTLGSDVETAMSLRQPFPRLADSVKGVPESVQKVLDNAVDKNMLRRYQSCREFRTQLASKLPGGTQIKTGIQGDDISVSIGREGCDVCIGADNYKVSRHHADIKRKNFTGGVFYVYTDCSSNGTTIDGQRYTRGMSYNIPRGSNPEILLAGDPACRLDLREIMSMLDKRAAIFERNQLGGDEKKPKTKTKSKQKPKAGPAAGGAPTMSFGGAIASVFRHYADFTGCATRAEFWWFAFFNFIVSCVLFGISALFGSSIIEMIQTYQILSGIWSLATLLPSLAVSVRRMHDTGRSGLTYFLCAIFSFLIIPAIYLLVCLLQKSDPDSKYRDEPDGEDEPDAPFSPPDSIA